MSVITDKLTSLMTTVRTITGVNNRLSLDEASSQLKTYSNAIGNWNKCIGSHNVLNSIMSSGYYYGYGANFSNKPANIANTDLVRLMVVNYSYKVLQVFATPSVIWARNYINNSWTDWKLLGGELRLFFLPLPQLGGA